MLLQVSVVWGSFLLLNSIFLNVFVHSLADEHLYCFQFLALTNNAAMNIYGQVFVLANIFISLSN